MTAFLVLLLLASVAGLAFLGYQAFDLHTKATRLEANLAAEQAQHGQALKQWSEYSERIKAQYQSLAKQHAAVTAENQRLSKWKNVADAEVKAAEMLRTAQATLEKAKADASNVMASVQEQARALTAETDEKVSSQLASANDEADKVISEARTKAKALKDESQAIGRSGFAAGGKSGLVGWCGMGGHRALMGSGV